MISIATTVCINDDNVRLPFDRFETLDGLVIYMYISHRYICIADAKKFSFHITSPSKVHFNSCKDVALYLKSQLETNGANSPDEGAMTLAEGDSPVEFDLVSKLLLVLLLFCF